MYHSLCFLAATLAAGETADAPKCATCEAKAQAAQPAAVVAEPATPPAAPRPGLIDRLAARLHLHRCGPLAPAPAKTAQPAQPAAEVVDQPEPQSGVKLISATVVADDGARPAAEVAKELQDKVGHADDYGWITGQLSYVHAGGGVWVLRYASIGEEDKYGGSFILSPAVSMKNFRDGDLVSVTGEILKEERAIQHLGGGLYRALSVNMVERADR